MYSVTEAFVSWIKGLGFSASTRVPKDAPDVPSEFVTIERTGGYAENLVDYPTLAVQTWAQTEDRAEEMANYIRAKAVLNERPEGVHSISVNAGPYPFFDEYTRCPRYQVVLDVVARFI